MYINKPNLSCLVSLQSITHTISYRNVKNEIKIIYSLKFPSNSFRFIQICSALFVVVMLADVSIVLLFLLQLLFAVTSLFLLFIYAETFYFLMNFKLKQTSKTFGKKTNPTHIRANVAVAQHNTANWNGNVKPAKKNTESVG